MADKDETLPEPVRAIWVNSLSIAWLYQYGKANAKLVLSIAPNGLCDTPLYTASTLREAIKERDEARAERDALRADVASLRTRLEDDK